MIRIIFAILLLVTTAHAEQIQCIETLAGAQYPEAVRSIPRQFGISGFAKREFGDFFPVARRALQDGRPWVGVNLLWSDTHDFSEKDLPFVINEAKRYEPLCQQYLNKIELRPFTEHKLKNPDALLDKVQAAVPSCKIVNSVWTGSLSKKYKNEVHGKHQAPQGEYNYSFDGTNSVDSQVYDTNKATGYLTRHKRAAVFCMWHPAINLRYSMKDSTPRAQRVKEAKQRAPNRELLLSLAYLFNPPGAIFVPKNWLIKSHAEKHGANDQKGDKLVIISPVRGAAIELKRDGKVVAKLPYYGTYEGGGYRYYWSQMGFRAGTETGLYIGKKQYGMINGGFRAPTFRD
jgi:hypothetical protein